MSSVCHHRLYDWSESRDPLFASGNHRVTRGCKSRHKQAGRASATSIETEKCETRLRFRSALCCMTHIRGAMIDIRLERERRKQSIYR